MTQNFEGSNLQGRSFVGQDLSAANFSRADIRGSNFSRAVLVGASFSQARAGLPMSWMVLLVTGAIGLAALAGMSAGLAGLVAAGMLQPYFNSFLEYRLLPGLIVWLVLAIFVISTVQHGFLAGFVIMAIALASVSVVVGTIANVLQGVGAGAFVMALAVIATLATTVSFGLVMAIVNPARLKLWLGGLSLATTVGVWIAFLNIWNFIATQLATNSSVKTVVEQVVSIVGALNIARSLVAVILEGRTAIIFSLIFTSALIGLGVYISRQSLRMVPQFALSQTFILSLAAIGGTQFRYSDLTDACFTGATLKNTVLRAANITRTDWLHVQSLDCADVGASYLRDPQIQQLVTTRRGQGKVFDRYSLRGINLQGANLIDASFIAANLSEATLQDADLSRARLVQTQLNQTNLMGACLTGAFIQDWRISRTTHLEAVKCEYVFTRLPTQENPDPGRKPDNYREAFAEGDFVDFIRPLVQTLDLYHTQQVDPRAVAIALHELIENHPEANIEIMALERRGEAQDKLLVRAKTSLDADLSALNAEYFSEYRRFESLSTQHLLQLLAEKDQQIRTLSDLVSRTVQIEQSQELPMRTTAEKRVVLRLGEGNDTAGFSVTLQIGLEEAMPTIEMTGKLPPAPELLEQYTHWQSLYRELIIQPRLQIVETAVTHFSRAEITDLAAELSDRFNHWLKATSFLPLREKLLQTLSPSDSVRLIIQTDSQLIQRLPWQAWDLLEDYRKAEILLCSLSYQQSELIKPARSRVRILVVLGDCTGIDLEADRQLLAALPDAETVFLVEPSRYQWDCQLWDEQGWDILCFAGHSYTDSSQGWIAINSDELLSLNNLSNSLNSAIERGLQLAIFNSCDGLGLANQLGGLNLPQVIVMREPVPDQVAQAFLKNFLQAFAAGKLFHQAVRQAREQLQGMEAEFPCASWMPIVFQNPTAPPLTWQELHGFGLLELRPLLAQLQAAIAAETELSPLDKAEAFEQVKLLAVAGQNPTELEMQRLAKTALRILRGMVREIPRHSAFVKRAEELLPAIASHLNLK